MWPVDDPPKAALHTTLAAGRQGPGQPAVRFDGPLNLLIALHVQQQAAVEVTRVNALYNEMKDD